MSDERIYVVQWSDDGTSWWVVFDQDDDGRKVPAAYFTVGEAEHRRTLMEDEFEDASYRVVGYEHEVR